MHAWLLGVAAAKSLVPLPNGFEVDPKDPLANVELAELALKGAESPAAALAAAPTAMLQRQMRSQAEALGSKVQAAHRVFAQQWKEQMEDIDEKGILSAPEIRAAYSVAKSKLVAMVQKSSSAELNGTQSDEQQKFYQNLRLGIVRFMTDVDSINLLEPYATSAGETARFVGSGFIVENHAEKGPLIITNAHVVNDAAKVEVQFPSNGQQPYRAQPILVNHDWDIAVVRILKTELPQLDKDLKEKGNDVKDLPVMKLYDGAFTSGMEVTAAGFPLGSPSCAITMGIISGQEAVAGNVQLQSTAPISPGNSGGPLLKKLEPGSQPETGPLHAEVVGINFAAADSELAQNVNYAIPSFRVNQVLEYLRENKDTHNVEHCQEHPIDCDMNVPKTNAVSVPGSPALYSAYGCKSGVLVTKVAQRSLLAHADPPIEADAFITEVNGVHLDRFGMGVSDHYVQDPIHFHDLMFMNKDMKTNPAKVKTCSCGETQEHSVDLEWKADYASNVPDHEQPYLAKLDFEVFGDVTIQPMSMQLAKALVMQAGMLNLVDYVIDVDHKPALIVTAAPEPQDFNGGITVQIGSIISKVNGKQVSTLEELRAAFVPEAAAGCKASSMLETERPSFWTLETQDGAFYGTPFKATLESMLKTADADRPITKVCRDAAEKLGLKIPELAAGAFVEGVVPKDRLRLPEKKIELPIEARSIERGGRTRSMTFFEEVHAIVPPAQLQSMLQKLFTAAEDHMDHVDARDKRQGKGMSLLQQEQLMEQDREQDQEDLKKFPNWFDGLIDLTKPLAAGMGL